MNCTIRAMLLAAAVSMPGSAGANLLLPASELIDGCRSYMTDVATEPAKFCAAYISGFMAGATNAGLLLSIEPGSSDAFLQRALRTRLGQSPRLPQPVYCVSTQVQVKDVVAQLLLHAEVRIDLQKVGAARMLGEVLREKYPC